MWEFVELVGYGVLLVVFIIIMVFILWFFVFVLEEVGCVILCLNIVMW